MEQIITYFSIKDECLVFHREPGLGQLVLNPCFECDFYGNPLSSIDLYVSKSIARQQGLNVLADRVEASTGFDYELASRFELTDKQFNEVNLSNIESIIKKRVGRAEFDLIGLRLEGGQIVTKPLFISYQQKINF